jgi:glycerophosphoryl diester phosphodiesterase
MKFCIFVISLFLGSELIASATPKIEIQGHRGARALRPENTIAAFQYALENKIEVLEMDLSYTKDHVLVLNHDPVINPILCLDPQGKKITNKLFIHEMNVSEVQKYDCGTLVNPRFTKQVPSPKEKIPTFEARKRF